MSCCSSDEERENVIKLISELKKENLATADHFMQVCCLHLLFYWERDVAPW